MPRCVASLMCVAALALAAFAQAPQQGTKFIGTWTMAPAQSKFTPAPGPSNETVAITATGVTIDGTQPDGKTYHFTYTPVDGKAVPVTGDQPHETVTITRISSRSVHIIISAGKENTTGMASLSKNNSTMTVTMSGTDANGRHTASHTIYTRQP